MAACADRSWFATWMHVSRLTSIPRIRERRVDDPKFMTGNSREKKSASAQTDFKTVSQFATVCQIEILLASLGAPGLELADLKLAFGPLVPRPSSAEPQQSGRSEASPADQPRPALTGPGSFADCREPAMLSGSGC